MNKAYSFQEVRQDHPNAYRKWTVHEDAILTERYRAGVTVADLAAEHGRKPGAIESRLRHLAFNTPSNVVETQFTPRSQEPRPDINNAPIERIEGIDGYCLLYDSGYAMFTTEGKEVVRVDGRLIPNAVDKLRHDLTHYPIIYTPTARS